MAIQSERSFSGVKFNNTSRNNWKPLFEVNFSKNSFGLINYRLIEISSSKSNFYLVDFCDEDFYADKESSPPTQKKSLGG